jgi:glyoxylase-like metal-dependent hydrolase (beta-lactamase superfamily II)
MDGEFKRWRIGDITVTRLIELGPLPLPVEALFPDATAADVLAEGWLAPHYANAEGRILLNFQGFLIETAGRRILVDTCIGEGKTLPAPNLSDMVGGFLQTLERAGARPGDIDTVLCTHLHFDHVGWNTQLVDGEWRATFPNARYLFARPELAFALTDKGHAGDESVAQSVQPILAAGLADEVETDEQVCPGVRLEPTPGHTPGHVSVWLESGGQTAVISGDCIHHPLQMARNAFVSGFCNDHDMARATRRKLLARLAGSPVLLIGTHFCEPTAGYVCTDGEAFRLTADAPATEPA